MNNCPRLKALWSIWGFKRTLLMVLACLLCILSSRVCAQSLERIFSSANEAYFQGNFKKAAEHYEKLIDAGVDDANVYFNMATTYARLGRYGKAILYFEKSLVIHPGDEKAEANLAACRDALGRKRADQKGEAFVQTRPPLIEALVRPFTENTMAWLVLVLDLAFFLVLIGLWLTDREPVRIALGIAAPLLGLLMLTAGAGLVIKSEVLKEGRAAIVLREEAQLREGPDPRAQVRAVAQEGQTARILEKEGEYVRVRLTAGAEGWMQKSDIGEI